MSAEPLGRSVLELATDQSQLNQGLTEARALTLRQTQAMKADARIELTANLLRLQSDFERARLLARNTARQADRESAFVLRVNLAQFQSDLRTAERERAASLRRMQQQGTTSLPGLGEGGPVSGFVSGVAGGATVAALGAVTSGFQQVAQAGKAAVGVTLDYNAAVQSATANIRAFTGSQEAVAYAQGIANKQLDLGRSGYQATLTALADITPLARRYGASLQDLLTTQQLLAALDPAQGFAGAAIALREALSGDFVSLSRRFEIPRTEIQRLKDEGLPNLEIVKRALAGLGITESLLDERARTFTQRQIIALDTLQKFVAEAGKPIFDTASDGLAGFIRLLNDPAIKEGAAKIAGELAVNLNDVRHTLEQLRGNADLRGIAEGAGEAASAIGELYDSLEGVRRVVVLGGLERLLTVLHAYSEGVGFVSGGISHLIEIEGRWVQELDREIDRLRQIAILRRLLGFIKPEEPTETIGQRVAPLTVATPPPTEAQFDISARAGEGNRQRQLFEQGRRDLAAYINGFSGAQLDIFGKVGPQIKAAFERAFGDLDLGQQMAHGLGTLDTLTARLVADLQQHGRVTEASAAQARAALGGEAQAVIDLVNQYGRLAAAQGGVQASTSALAIAQSNLGRVQAEAATHIAAAEHALTVAQGAAATHQQQTQNALQSLQEDLRGIDREAQSVARAYDDQLRGLQGLLTASQRASEEAQRQFAAQIEAAQREQEAIQAAGQQHSDAFAAILSGNTDEFLRNKQLENEALDEQTRKILEAGQAYLQFARDATAADHAVRAADEREHQIRLDFERRIQAARNANRPGEVARLSAERDRVLARERANSQVTRAEAVVAGDKAQDARDPIQKAAGEQAEKDKIAATAAGKRVEEIQEQAKQRAEADRLAQQALSDQIAAVQEEARQSAQMYADRKQGVQDEITEVERRARIQKAADDAAIAGAQAALTLVQQIETARINAAKQGVSNAQLALNTANAEVIAQTRTLGIMGQKQTALDTYIDTWKKFIEYLKAQNVDVAQFFGGTPATRPSTTQNTGNPTTGPNAGDSGSPVKTPNRPPVFPPAQPPPPVCPPGSHPEYDAANDSWSCMKEGGFFGGVGTSLQRTYTAPSAPTATYRAPVPPALNAASYTAGLAAASLAARPAPGGAAGMTYILNRELVHIDTVNASDPLDVDNMIRRVKAEALDEVFGTGLEAFEVAKRGSVVTGLRR